MRKFKRVNNMRFGICVTVLLLIMSQGGVKNGNIKNIESTIIKKEKINYVEDNPNILKKFRKLYIKEALKPTPIKSDILWSVTSYDLSVRSCSKSRSDPEFGVTKLGINLRGKTIENIKVISVDPNYISLGTKVRLTFLDTKYQIYNNIYICGDTGGGIKGRKIDLFLGDYVSSEITKSFGVTKAYVEIIKEN